jgi:hypothetical protein
LVHTTWFAYTPPRVLPNQQDPLNFNKLALGEAGTINSMATFGWSAGDLVLVIQTVGAIIDALDKADGASAQYQSTTAFLKSLINTLHHLRSATAVGLDPSYTAAVHAQVDLIKNPLTEFIGEIAKYERSLGKGSTRGSLQALPRKLHWAFAVEQKVAKLERKVAGPLSCISILLTQQTL